MYKSEDKTPDIPNFILPFGGKLNPNNRWVILSKIIPWGEFEGLYKNHFNDRGAPAKSFRMALGTLLIKEKLNLTDEETVQQIHENPYLQYFIGYEDYQEKKILDSSTLVYFRKRITLEMLKEINEKILESSKSKPKENKKDDKDDNSPNNQSQENEKTENKGKLILDATCAPEDIKYPTDLNLLNECREKTEKILDILQSRNENEGKRVRTYRRKARKDYLLVAKNKKPNKKLIRKAIGKQIRYLRRNLNNIKKFEEKESYGLLNDKLLKMMETIKKIYEQQKYMFDKKVNRVTDRIVSLSKPHVRPIVRGKLNAPVEFGSKITLSVVKGFSYITKLSWNNYNEQEDLIPSVENYYLKFGCYPKVILADKIFNNAKNQEYCREKGIRISGRPLGRPKKDENKRIKLIRQMRKDEGGRVAVEGKFGIFKRKYGMSRIMTKLSETSESVIGLIVLVSNLDKKLRLIFYPFWYIKNLLNIIKNIFNYSQEKYLFSKP